MNKLLILGATGHIAGATADLIYEQSPDDLRLASSREAGLDKLLKQFPNAEVVQADWNDQPSLVAAMDGISRLLIVTPQFTDEDTVTPNIIAAAKAASSIELIVRLIANPPGMTANDMPSGYTNQHVVAKPLLDASGLPIAYVNVPIWIMFNLAWWFGTEVRQNRRLAFPAATNRERMWISEGDIAAVIANVLTGSSEKHVGQEYVLTSNERYAYEDLARVLSHQLGEVVPYVDDDETLRKEMGDDFDAVMAYFKVEKQIFGGLTPDGTLEEMLDRPPQSLGDYVAAHLDDFA